MLTNLFSVFDPVNIHGNSLFYFYLVFNFICFFNNYWLNSSFFLIFLDKFISSIFFEMKDVKLNSNQMLIYISLFFVIFSQNLMGLMPYVFVCSAHISLNFGLSLWLVYLVVFKMWCLNPIFSLSALVPVGTPLFLVFVMVVIETISDWIRPLTLSVRLSANLTAGHLILSLLSGSLLNFFSFICLPVGVSYFFLSLLEFMIAIIQAFVFSLLFLMYSKSNS